MFAPLDTTFHPATMSDMESNTTTSPFTHLSPSDCYLIISALQFFRSFKAEMQSCEVDDEQSQNYAEDVKDIDDLIKRIKNRT